MRENLRGVVARQRHDAASSLRNAARAALLLPLVLMGCSSVALPTEEAPAAGPKPAYSKTIADRLRTFKDYATYDSFEISEFRWVHSVNGWNWLTCVRFQDHGRRRTYALFLKDDAIVNSRFAVESDGCDTQGYSPFDLAGGQSRPANAAGLAPLY